MVTLQQGSKRYCETIGETCLGVRTPNTGAFNGLFVTFSGHSCGCFLSVQDARGHEASSVVLQPCLVLSFISFPSSSNRSGCKRAHEHAKRQMLCEEVEQQCLHDMPGHDPQRLRLCFCSKDARR